MNQLILGDCLEKMKDIPDASVDMCLTDPPYGTTACKWDNVIPFEPMWKELKRIVKPNGAICLFGSEPFSSKLRMSNLKMFKYDWVWVKNYASGFVFSKYQPMRDNEIISVFYIGKPCYFPQFVDSKIKDRALGKRNGLFKPTTTSDHTGGMRFDKSKNNPNNILKDKVNPRTTIRNIKSVPRALGTFHPTQKPVPLLEYLIKTYTLEGETVLDFTMGSGSTGVACVNLNRHFIGIEKDEIYYNIGVKRVKEAQDAKTKI